nr:MAG TPA: hypothetical protein [Caudoviricetes sp.]
MDIKDIIALASAGFTAQQIATMATTAPAPAPAPAPVPAPVPAPAPAPVPVDPIMEQLKALTTAVQSNAIINSQLPITQPETPEDILASIINPPTIVNNK